MRGILVGDPPLPLPFVKSRMKEDRYRARLTGESDHRSQPMADGQTHSGERNRYGKHKRKHQTDSAPLAQQEPSLGNGVRNHGGHIPS
jgi:hypothetical protein